MADTIDVSGTHTREDIAKHLENLADSLRQGGDVTLLQRNKDTDETNEVNLGVPQAPDFELSVDRNTSFTGNLQESTLNINLSWDEGQRTDDEELAVK